MLDFIQKLFTIPAQAKSTQRQRRNKSESRISDDVVFEDIKLKKRNRAFAHVQKGSCGFNICGLDCGCCE